MTQAPSAGGRTVPRRPGSAGTPGSAPGVPARPQGAPQGRPQAAGPGRASKGRIRRRLRRTPGRLRLAIAVTVLVGLAVSLCGLLVLTNHQARVSAVVERVDAVVGLQESRAALVAANGVASNAFLVGGLEPAEQRETYDAFLTQGTSGLASLASSDADRSGDLLPAVAAVTEYSGLVAQARANNRQGFPVGAAYLDTASVVLAEEVLPPIDAAIVDNAERTATQLNSGASQQALLLIVLVAVGVLVVVQVWLTRRTRRRVNVPLLVASVLFVGAGLATAGSLATANDSMTQTRQGPYADILATSQALSLAGEARTAESFGLIQRGSGQRYEETFTAAMDEAAAQLNRASSSDVRTALSAWRDAHDEIRALDDAGDWDGAVALATSTDEGSPSQRYAEFVTQAEAEVAALDERTEAGFRGGGTALGFWSIVLIASGVAGALLSWRGLNKRLEEYR